MNKAKCTFFKYKGHKFMFDENNFDFLTGFRAKRNGIILVSINKNLSGRKRTLELHRLITGRGLRKMKKNLEFV